MLKNLRVRTRLMMILAVSSIALLGVGLLGLFNGHRLSNEINIVYYGGLDKASELFTIRSAITDKVVTTLQKVRQGTVTPTDAIQELKEGQATIDTHWNNYANTDSELNEQNTLTQKSVVEQTRPLVKFLDELIIQAEDALRLQNKPQINTIVDKSLYPATDPLLASLDKFVDLHIQDTNSDYQNALVSVFWFQVSMWSGLILALAILIPLTIAIIRSVVKPIEYAIHAIAVGDTSVDIKIMSGGELGSLLESLRSMFISLDKVSSVLTAISTGDLTVEGSLRSDRDVLGHALHDMVTQTRIMIGEIKDEVTSLTTSSQEIMTSLTHISSGAAEAASAVTETTTTIEELKQTANISVDKAKDVLANAEETLQAVASSEKSVMATIEDMNQIRERMQIISDSILKLSEKGNAIAEIMDTVNDIAEQSNLLAVNAAIEAAKAGEVGRSFGVVAQEIRTLAEQSKAATVQVRALLNDIQTATGSAVLATEQGSKAVTKGVEQSTKTTKTIKELTTKMSKVNQAANQIVMSNQQQLVGTEQITVAMTQISETTNQHVEHLRQIEIAVKRLNQVGTTLKGMTDKYRLSSDEKQSGKLTSDLKHRRLEHLVETSV